MTRVWKVERGAQSFPRAYLPVSPSSSPLPLHTYVDRINLDPPSSLSTGTIDRSSAFPLFLFMCEQSIASFPPTCECRQSWPFYRAIFALDVWRTSPSKATFRKTAARCHMHEGKLRYLLLPRSSIAIWTTQLSLFPSLLGAIFP